jgi:hypothetical protein
MNKLSQSLLSALSALSVMFLLIVSPPVFADVEASDYTQTRIGMVHSLDLANKTAVISGYRYSFTGTKGWDLPSVKMYGTDYGAFELLRKDMKVRVTYRLSKMSRVVVALRQVSEDTRLGIPDDIEP